VSGQLHAPVTLPLGEEKLVSIDLVSPKAGFGTVVEKIKIAAPVESKPRSLSP
jgi:hypothetical protein